MIHIGRIAATTGRNLVEMKKNSTSRHLGIGRPAMLHKVQRAAGPQHPSDLRQCSVNVGDRAQRPCREHVVDRAVLQWKLLAVEVVVAHRAVLAAVGARWRVAPAFGDQAVLELCQSLEPFIHRQAIVVAKRKVVR